MKSGVWRGCIFFLYLLMLSQVACSQESVRPGTAADDPVGAEAASRQFRIYRDALQQGSTDDIRVDAAVGLLLQNDEQGRGALLSALKSEDNPQARQAVCRALIKSRGLSQTVDSLEVFTEPLLAILQGESVEEAELAAEAMLLFDYSAVAGFLDQILYDKERDRRIRINAIYALKLRTEPIALRGLIKLLDDSDAEVAKAAETALQEAFGIPVGASRAVWSGILDELELKSPDDIRKERLLRQEMKMRQVQAERDRWQKLYIDALNKQYELLNEKSQESAILDRLGSDLDPVRIWALDKASKYPVISDELSEKLLSLLSDGSRDVRLQAAKAFMNMPSLNPAAVLLEQLQSEEDAEVKLAMLESLGEACFFAFSPGTEIKLPEDIKLKTLEIASGYLRSESPDDCIKGAEVIRKVLELNSLGDDSTRSFLGLLNERYQKTLSQDKELRAELLAILAHLCGQGGAKDSARALFGPLFLDAVVIENDSALRLAAVQGLSYVDKVQAFELYKKNNLIQDPSPAVQQVVIDVAGQIGGTEDLKWLLGLLADNGHSDRVWLAIKKICQHQDVAFLLAWLPELESVGAAKGEYVRDILDIAEQKAAAEKEQGLLKQVRERTISWLVQRKAWEQASAYLAGINYLLSENIYSDQMNFAAFSIHLYSGEVKKAAEYIRMRILVSDIEHNSPLAAAISSYFSDETVEDASKALLLKEIKPIPDDERPAWSAFVDGFSKQPDSVSRDPENSEEGVGE